MSFEYNLILAMREHDLHINSINLEIGKYHRFRSISTCKSKCCEYRIFENQLGAHFKCFRRGIDRFWFAQDRKTLNYEDQKLLQQERDSATRAKLVAQSLKSVACAKFLSVAARSQLNPINHPYSLKKQIYPHAAHLARGMLVLPVRDIDYELMSLQFIHSSGFKQFKAGAPTAEGMIWLGGQLKDNYEGVLRICEGWATGCTIYSITKSPVICALNAYNLIKVARLFRTYYPRAIVKICADNDCWSKENVGLRCGLQAALENGYSLHYPEFDQLNTSSKPTDYNDLFAIGGLSVTKNQLILIKNSKSIKEKL